jgi:hypothetical protein
MSTDKDRPSDENRDEVETDEPTAGPVVRTPRDEESKEPTETSEDGIRDLLRGAFGEETSDVPDVLRGVQRKIRQRSRGKFYADGWSTTKQPPITTYLITSLVMLAIILFVWAVLSPLSGDPAPVDPPAPVNVVPGPSHRMP